MKAPFLLLPVLFLILLSAGCATNNAIIVSARHNAPFSPTPADKISMALRPNPNAEDAALGSVLLAELTREGFDIVTNADADYSLAYLVEDDSTEETYMSRQTVQTSNPYYVMPPPQTTAQMMYPSDTEFQNLDTAIVPTTLVFQKKGIRLYLYANPKKHPGGLQIAWEGCIQAGKKIPPERVPVLIRALLVYYGQDYNGPVTLPP